LRTADRITQTLAARFGELVLQPSITVVEIRASGSID
jgi:hypothetical protein